MSVFDIRSSQLLLIGALLLALIGSYLLFRPYLEPILLAFLTSLLVHPLDQRLKSLLGQRATLASLITCLLVTVVLLIPTFVALGALVEQGAVYVSALIKWVEGGGISELMQQPWVVTLTNTLEELLPQELLSAERLKEQVLTLASGLGTSLLGASRQVAGGLLGILVDLGLMMLVLFFILRDYDKLTAFLRHAIPLSRSQEDQLLNETAAVTRSALLGNVLTALIQGAVGGFGMWLAGFPGFFWGSMMALASFIPVVGTALIWVPAALFLFFSGEINWGIFLVAWGALVVGGIDNFVRPMFMSGASSVNGLLIFLSILGGLNLFGILGLIYGPLIISLTLVLYRLYEQEFDAFLQHQDKQ